jgi:hypothetical protein
MTIQRDDLCPPELRWQWSIIQLNCGVMLPFFSYSGKRLVIQCGWQPFGYAESKINWRTVPFLRECVISHVSQDAAITAAAANLRRSGVLTRRCGR